jgi:hypothetical protein
MSGGGCFTLGLFVCHRRTPARAGLDSAPFAAPREPEEAREKLSTVSVDKFGGKISGLPDFPCFLPASLRRLIFRRISNTLISPERFLRLWQITDNLGEFVTVA